jgi:hypothetical protein
MGAEEMYAMLPTNPMDYAFSVLRDFYKLSDGEIASLEPAAFVDRLKGIHRGFNAEHEFAAIASWLGRCKLVAHPDEVYSTDGSYRVPDFLIVSQLGDHQIPFLVEVKTTGDTELVWTEKYLTSVRRFAGLMNLPLLVAWKHHGLWSLCDSELFEKAQTAFHLSFDTALKNNLMTALFGNVFVTVKEGLRFELRLKLLDEVDAATELLPEGYYKAQITEAGLHTYKGRVPDEQMADLFPIFLTKAAEPRTEREGAYLRHIFPTDPEGMFNLSDLLFTNLMWNRKAGEEVDWIAEIRKGLPTNTTDLHTVLRRGLDVGAIQYVLQQQPATVPTFLKGILQESGETQEN